MTTYQIRNDGSEWVNVCVTIPKPLRDQARAKGLSFSRILTDYLKSKMEASGNATV